MIGMQLIGQDKAYLAKRGGGVIANVNEINQLDAGAVAIIDGQKLINTVAALTDSKSVQIAVGSSTQELGAVLSKRIERQSSDFKENYSFKAYAAPRSEVLYIGDNGDNLTDIVLPISLLVGEEVSATIRDTSNNTIPEGVIKTANYSIKNGDTKGTVINGLVAAINKLNMGVATAITPTTANAGIKFVGAKVGVRYKINLGGLLVGTSMFSKFNEAGSVITTANAPVAPFIGTGTYELIKEQANYLSTVFGDTSRNMLREELFNSKDAINDAVFGTNYDTFTFNYSLSGYYTTTTRSSVPQFFQLVIPTGVAVVSVLQGLFLGVVAESQASETGEAEEAENA